MDTIKEIKDNFDYLAGIFESFCETTKDRRYLTPEHMRKLKKEVVRVERERKLERVFGKSYLS